MDDQDKEERKRYWRIAEALRKRRRMSRLERLAERLHLRAPLLAPEDARTARSPVFDVVMLYPDSLEHQLRLLSDIGTPRDRVHLLAAHAQQPRHV